MALIHVFDGVTKKTTYTFCGRIRDHIEGIDWEHSVLLRGGYRISPDYEVQPDDIVFVRRTPAAVSTAVIAVTATVAVVAGIVAGVALYNSLKAQDEMEEAERMSRAAAEGVNKLPFIRGARNQAATGRSFPYAIGESLMTPYRLGSPFYTIAGTRGEEQFYNVVLEVAFNDILIKKIRMGETDIKTFSDTAPQNGQYSWDKGVYYDARNLIEIRQTGAFTEDSFNSKKVLTELTKQIPHAPHSDNAEEQAKNTEEWQTGVVQDCASNTMSVDVIVLFDGLQKYQDSEWRSQTVTLSPQWTNAANPQESDWHDFTYGFNQNGTYSNTFTYNTKEQMRYLARQDFSAAQAYGKQIKIRVRRMTERAESSAKDTVYLLAVQSTCYDPKQSSASSLITAPLIDAYQRDKCTRIGIRVAANQNTEGQLDAFSVIEQGCARTWNGSAWSQTKTPTSNLAAWALELLTSPHHKPSKYLDSELDLDSFGAWYEYCAEQGFRADGVITNNTRKRNVLDTLCTNGNAALVYNNFTGLMEVAIDNGRDYSVALLNSENIVSISTLKEFKRKTTGKKVTYINSAANYDPDSVIFMRDEAGYDPASDTLTEESLQFVTTYNHAYKIAWRKMAEELIQPRVVTVKAGMESAYYPLYSRVELQHKSLKIGIAHGVIKSLEWRNSYLQKIVLVGYVNFPANTACGVIINCVSDNGRGVLPLKVTGTGRTNTLTVTTTLRNNAPVIPAAGNLLSFGALDGDGEFTTVTRPMKITNTEQDNEGFTLTLVDYKPELYEYGTLPNYTTNISRQINPVPFPVNQQRNYIQLGDAQALTADSVQAAVDTVTHGQRFTNIYKVRPAETTLDEIIAKIDDDARNQTASISISEEEILLQVENVEKGLVGLIDIQAGAVTALVEGGGASGQMSLTLNLPVLIDATTYAKLVQASTAQKVAAVYALLDGTSGAGARYAIKGNATDADVKALWDDAVDDGLLASQIELEADQIYINGDVIVNDEKKIKAAMIDVQNLLASDITVKDKGVIHSDNYNGTIDANGNITASGTTGWAIDHNGRGDFNNVTLSGSITNSKTVYDTNTAILKNIKGNNLVFVSSFATPGYSETLTRIEAVFVTTQSSGTESGIWLDYCTPTAILYCSDTCTISTNTYRDTWEITEYKRPQVTVTGTLDRIMVTSLGVF